MLRFADRFLDHRFGDSMLDLSALNVRDVVAFMEHQLARKRPFRDKTPATHLRSFFQNLFAQGLTTINLSEFDVDRRAAASPETHPGSYRPSDELLAFTPRGALIMPNCRVAKRRHNGRQTRPCGIFQLTA
ncbi:hypothetical protein [Rhizobium sp. YS-1r]|uniref:hypothetical protein n=1 Tax=Rhizobium sp. YS-1r TaxID=1532558 RepID=UPI0006899D48|nr:hypothetical protein [Rhizobium sp. YS-1r]